MLEVRLNLKNFKPIFFDTGKNESRLKPIQYKLFFDSFRWLFLVLISRSKKIKTHSKTIFLHNFIAGNKNDHDLGVFYKIEWLLVFNKAAKF